MILIRFFTVIKFRKYLKKQQLGCVRKLNSRNLYGPETSPIHWIPTGDMSLQRSPGVSPWVSSELLRAEGVAPTALSAGNPHSGWRRRKPFL
ncbi:MAG: hypothetical protein A4E62_01023 [Syntrophorhabdus sp. PtaU1.Bin002]|nr:MAG: hypothetical protein A4E62_01023 [Syntrophorhabdus sp. PtaU1.Bin002]